MVASVAVDPNQPLDFEPADAKSDPRSWSVVWTINRERRIADGAARIQECKINANTDPVGWHRFEATWVGRSIYDVGMRLEIWPHCWPDDAWLSDATAQPHPL